MTAQHIIGPVRSTLCALCLIGLVILALGTAAPGCGKQPPPEPLQSEGEHTADGEAQPTEGEAPAQEGQAQTEGEVPPEGEPQPPEGESASVLCPGDCTYEIVRTYPHDANAFTQGLVYDEGRLYEGTGLYGQSDLRVVDLETGEILQRVPLERTYFGEGIALFQERIIQLTWRQGVGFVYDKSTLTAYDHFAYDTEGWGLTHDGAHLIMSDGTSTLYYRDPISYAVVGTLQVQDNGAPVHRLNELEYVDGEILANVWRTDKIVRVHPTTGDVMGWIHLNGLAEEAGITSADAVLNGIAYDPDGKRLFVTGKLWPRLFEIRLLPLTN